LPRINNILPPSFYLNPDVVSLARQLLGKTLCVHAGAFECKAIITETEAYNGVTDKASHSYGGRRTSRNEIMYGPGGYSYVYLCYGMHYLFNVVTSAVDDPKAVLIRAVWPITGTEVMEERRGRKLQAKGFSDGPGKVCAALGINLSHNGMSLMEKKLRIEDSPFFVPEKKLRITPRIGVDYAGKDALLPYRFLWERPYEDLR